MKNLILVLLALLSYTLLAKKIDGYIVNKGDTSYVTLYVQCELGKPSLTANYEYFEYSYNRRDRLILYPEEGCEVHFIYKDESYVFKTFEPFSDQCKSNLGFMCVEREGKYLSAVIAVDVIEEKVCVNHEEQLIIEEVSKETKTTFYSLDKGFMKFGIFNFREQAKEYFSDCPDLVDKIEKKEFKRSSWLEIVDFYNACKAESP